MTQEQDGKPLGGRLILRRRLTPRAENPAQAKRVLGSSRAMKINTVSALQSAVTRAGHLSHSEWYSARVLTLADHLYPVCFDQVSPFNLFYELDKKGCLQAYHHNSLVRGQGTAHYLGPASTAKMGTGFGLMVFRHFEIVLVHEAEGLRVSQFTESLARIGKALDFYRTRPDEANAPKEARELQHTRCP